MQGIMATQTPKTPRNAALFDDDRKLVQFRMSEAERRRLKLWAVEHDMSMNAAICEAIRLMVESDEGADTK